MNERKFLAVNKKMGGVTKVVLKDGAEGTGLTLPFSCGFCRDTHGNVTAAFRTRKERNAHTNRCPN
jgi:hypothetical protein